MPQEGRSSAKGLRRFRGSLLVPRLLLTSSSVSAATSVRLVADCAELVVSRAPSLVLLGVAAFADGSGETQNAFRDEFIGFARGSAEITWRELRRAVDELDARTRDDHHVATQEPKRPYRVKP